MATPKTETPIPAQMPDDVEKFENFFHFYEQVPDKPLYREMIRNLQGLDELIFLYEDLATYDPGLAERLRDNPENRLDDASEALKNIMRIDRGGNLTPLEEENLHCRVFTKDNSLFVPLRDLEQAHIEKLVYLKGTVTGISKVKPEIVSLTVECKDCGHQFEIDQYDLEMKYPKRCLNPGCKNKGEFITIKRDTKRVNWQSLGVVECIDEIPDGRIPESQTAIMRGNLVNLCRPGDVFSMMAIYQMWPAKNNLRVWDTNIQGIMMEATSQLPVSITISDEDLQEILKLSKLPEIRKKLCYSFSPSIVGRDDAKMAILFLIVGGNPRKRKDGAHIRGDIHILLVGDPGVGKSALIESLQLLCPRVIVSTGGGVSKAGITAAVVKDEITGSYSLQAGVLVLADQGYAVIDEIDKMEAEDRANIYSAMEQQRIHLNKAGINATLNSRASVLAAANPKGGRWDASKSSVDNLRKLPPFLLSRFDEIIVMVDLPDHKRDSIIGRAILGLDNSSLNPPANEDERIKIPEEEDFIPRDLLGKYLYYARHNIKPVFTKEASQHLLDFYVGMRDQYDATKAVSLSPRNLEGLQRLIEAWAKLGLQKQVTLDDVKQVISEIYLPYLKTVGYDEMRQEFNVDSLTSGLTNSVKNALNYGLNLLREMMRENKNQPVQEDDFKERLSVDPEKIDKLESSYVVQKLINEKMVDLVNLNGEKCLKILR
jgi:replicative DNA helicase Mcm